MKKVLFLSILFSMHQMVFGQYWFGPKIGLNYVDPVYQDKTFEDTYEVDNDFDFHIGAALSYEASDLYSVYTEIVYERTNRDLRSRPDDSGIFARSEVVNQFITVPVMLRITLGRVPFHYYVNGGPKVSYWLSSKGSWLLSSFEEEVILDENGVALETIQPRDFEITFNSGKDNASDVLLVSSPNRLQFGLVVGAGAFFDLISGARLMIDFRYSFGHSNFGFDDDEDIWFDHRSTDNYLESFEYSLNTASVSIGYLFGYNAQFKRKGKSTNRESNKRKK